MKEVIYFLFFDSLVIIFAAFDSTLNKWPMALKRIPAVLILLFIVTGVFANFPSTINYGRNIYKAGNKNWALATDSTGIIYAANNDGLLQFDGLRWQLHHLKNNSNATKSVYVDKKGCLFTGAYKEFGYWIRDDFGQLNYTSLSDQLKGFQFSNDEFWSIIELDGKIYFQSFNSLFVYDYKSVRPIYTDNQLVLLRKAGNRAFVQHVFRGLFELKKDKLIKIAGSEILNGSEVRVILPLSDNRLLLGTSHHGFYIYDGKEFISWSNPAIDQITRSDINNGIINSNGDFIFGTILNGVYIVSPQGILINHFSSDNYLQNNTVYALLQDQDQNVWIGLDKGISQMITFPSLDCYVDFTGKTGSVFTSALFGNKLYLGTNRGLFYISKTDLKSPDAMTKFQLIPGSQGQVWSLNVSGNQLLCTHNNGVFSIENNQFLPIYKGIGVFNLNHLQLDDKEYLFGGTYASPLLLKKDNEDKWVFSHLLEGFLQPSKNVEIDHLGNVWIGHERGGVFLARLSSDLKSLHEVTDIHYDTSLHNKNKLKVFKLGSRIVFTSDRKFFAYNDVNNSITPFSRLNLELQGLEETHNIVKINRWLYWFIGKKTIHQVYYDELSSRVMFNLDLHSPYFSLVDGYENINAFNDTTSLVCMDNGFLLTNTKVHINRNELPIPRFLQIDAISRDHDILHLPVNSTKKIEINSERQYLEFYLTAKGMVSAAYSFQYKLEGLDSDWSQPSRNPKLVFHRLPRGNYTLQVRTTDNNGGFSEPFIYKFRVLPSFYKSGIAIMLYMFLAVILFMLILYLVVRSISKKQLLELRQIEEQKLKDLNHELLIEIEAKRTELLNSTSSIIKKNEVLANIRDEIDGYYNNQSSKFPKMAYDKITRLLNKNMDPDEDWTFFQMNFEQTHPGFLQKIKEQFPVLTPNDMKLCACLKLNLNSKEIASLLNISVRGVEISRYRLRKKLDMESGDNLNEFFMKL